MSNNDINELVESAASYAGRLYRGLQKIVDDLREDNVRSGLKSLAKATEGLEWIMDAIIHINNSGMYEEFNINEIKDFFTEINEAAENMDFVLIADLVEYEIMPIIDKWGLKLDGILENI